MLSSCCTIVDGLNHPTSNQWTLQYKTAMILKIQRCQLSSWKEFLWVTTEVTSSGDATHKVYLL